MCGERFEDRRRRGQWRIRWYDSITDLKDMNFSRLWEAVEDRGVRLSSVLGVSELYVT